MTTAVRTPLPVYTTGTVAGSVGSPVITGTGTAWIASDAGGNQVNVVSGGDLLVLSDRAIPIKSVDSATQVTLECALPSAIAPGSIYRIIRYQANLVGGVTAALAAVLAMGTDASPEASLAVDNGAGRLKLRTATSGHLQVAVGPANTADAALATAFDITPGGAVQASISLAGPSNTLDDGSGNASVTGTLAVKTLATKVIATGTAVGQSLADSAALYLTLEQFGGVGDWATDNTAAWNAAVVAFGTKQAVVNLDPTKGYYFGSTITVPANWTIDGHTRSPQTINQGADWTKPGQTWNPTTSRAVGFMRWYANPAVGDLVHFGPSDGTRSQVNFVSSVGTQGNGTPSGRYVVGTAQTAKSAVLALTGAGGITAGMAVYGYGIVPGTTVSGVSGNSVTLSAATNAVLGVNTILFFGGSPYQVAIGATVAQTIANLYGFLAGPVGQADANLALFNFLAPNTFTILNNDGKTTSTFTSFEFFAAARVAAASNYIFGASIASAGILQMLVNGIPAGTAINNGWSQASPLWNMSVGLGGSMLFGQSSGATCGILYNRGCTFQNLRVLPANIQSPPTGPAMAYAQIQGFTGTAFQPAAGTANFTHEVTFDTLFIGGFNQAITYYGDRLRANFVSHDCTHGVDLSGAYEVWEMKRVLANGLLHSHYTDAFAGWDNSYRAGTHIFVHDGGSAGLIDGCFSFGHAAKVVLGNEFGIGVRNCGGDGGVLGGYTGLSVSPNLPAMLDITVTAIGANYGASTTATSSNGDLLAVTMSNGSIAAITCVKPAPAPLSTGVPTITLHDPSGAGTGFSCTVAYTNTINFQTYGGSDRFNFTHCWSDVAGTAMKLAGPGNIVVTGSLFTGSHVRDIDIAAGTDAFINGGQYNSGLVAGANGYNIYVRPNAGTVSLANLGMNSTTGGIFVDPTNTSVTQWGNVRGGASAAFGVSLTGSATFAGLTVSGISTLGSGANGATALVTNAPNGVGLQLALNSAIRDISNGGATYIDFGFGGASVPSLTFRATNNATAVFAMNNTSVNALVSFTASGGAQNGANAGTPAITFPPSTYNQSGAGPNLLGMSGYGIGIGNVFDLDFYLGSGNGAFRFYAGSTLVGSLDYRGNISATSLNTTGSLSQGGSPVATQARTQVSDAGYAAAPTDRTVAYIALTAARTVTLPAASSFPGGAVLTIVDESGACSPANAIALAAADSDRINGLAALAIATPYGAVALESNTSHKWTVVERTAIANRTSFTDVASANSNQAVGTGFTTIVMGTVNQDTGNNWSSANNWYTCPRSGIYQITGTIRVADGTAPGSTYSCGVYTANQDGPWHLWTAVGPSPATRSTFAYSRLSYQNAGDQLRMFSYSDAAGGVKVIGAGLQICLVSDAL